MADIVNLRQARKRKARAEKDQRAEDNRLKHGRTKAEKDHAAAKDDLERRRLDGLKLIRDDD
jgi:hypothetical protein